MKTKTLRFFGFALAAFLAIAPNLAAQSSKFMSVDEVRQGMKGFGKTVFQGTTIEQFDVEVLGVLKNFAPRQDMILARLSGGPLEKTGAIADAYPDAASRFRRVANCSATIRTFVQRVRFHPCAGGRRCQRGELEGCGPEQAGARIVGQRRNDSRRPQLERQRYGHVRGWRQSICIRSEERRVGKECGFVDFMVIYNIVSRAHLILLAIF